MTADVNIPLDQQPADDEQSQVDARRFVSQLIADLRDGEYFDAQSVLRQHPSLGRFKSVVLDLAYEQYCRQREAGRKLDHESFADRFPEIRYSLLRMLDVHSYIDAKQLDGAALPWPEPGQWFAGFLLEEELGRGAFSRVFLALDPNVSGRAMVVKVSMHGDYEVDALAQLQHDHIVPVYTAPTDETSSLRAISMPFFGRTTLFDLLDHAYRDGRPPTSARVIVETLRKTICKAAGGELRRHERRSQDLLARRGFVEAVVDIGLQLAEALDYTHSCGLCHGDLKPSNVLLTSEGKAMLFDFNLAFGGEQQGRIGGTLPYMSPEQLRATTGADSRGVKVDERSDIFSFGAMLYQLLTGKLPFGAPPQQEEPRRSAVELLARQETGPAPLREKNPRVEPRLAAVIERCLAWEPAARYQSARAMADALRQAQPQPGRKLSRRALLLTGSAACLGLGALATAISYLPKTPNAAPSIASPPVAPLPSAKEGLEAYFARDYQKAVEILGHLPIEQLEEPHRVALGHSYIRKLEFSSALTALRDVEVGREPSPDLLACRVYCRARQRLVNANFDAWDVLCDLLSVVMEQKGLKTPELRNDLAFCMMRDKRHADQADQIANLNQARRLLQEALAEKPALRAAHHNLAIVEWKLALLEQRRPDPRWLDALLRLAPPSSEAFLTALSSHAVSANFAPDTASKNADLDACEQYCRSAQQLGASKSNLNAAATYCRVLSTREEFREIVKAAGDDQNALTECLVEPLGGDDLLLPRTN